MFPMLEATDRARETVRSVGAWGRRARWASSWHPQTTDNRAADRFRRSQEVDDALSQMSGLSNHE